MELSQLLNPADSGIDINALSFGARYISYRNVDGFTTQTNGMELGLISWPGGALSEVRDDRYGFDFDDLYDPATGKPGLSDMMALARDEEAALSIVIPTARYLDPTKSISDDIQTFVDDLLGGDYGALPSKLILQIGSEYYGTFADQSDPALVYATIANELIEELSLALVEDSDPLVDVDDISIAVQIGKTFEEDAIIRENLSSFSMSNIDLLIHNRFAYEIQGIDKRIDRVEEILEDWNISDGDDTASNLFLAGWNTVTLTRTWVASDYEKLHATVLSDDEIADRSNTDFEEYWQDRLDEPAYGQEQAAYILEAFSSYSELGVGASTIYGVNVEHPGRLSYRDADGEDETFVGAEMLEMIHESVGGTSVLKSKKDYSWSDEASIYGFESDDKIIFFVAAGRSDTGLLTLDLTPFTDSFEGIWAESLTSDIQDDWMERYDIPDNPNVDESAEAETFAVPVRNELDVSIHDNTLFFSLSQAYEVARISIAKTTEGVSDISDWSLVPGETELTLDQVPEGELSEFLTAAELEADADSGGGAGLGLAGALLAVLSILSFV